MPQEIRVVRCFQCLIFQTDIVKKAKKWQCKLCGEKQSVLKEFGRGTGKECRIHAQKLNENAATKENAKLEAVQNVLENLEEHEENELLEESLSNNSGSKWENYVAEEDEDESEEEIIRVHPGGSNLKEERQAYSTEEEASPTKHKRQRISEEYESCTGTQYTSLAKSVASKSEKSAGISTLNSQKNIIGNNRLNTEKQDMASKTASKWANYLDDD